MSAGRVVGSGLCVGSGFSRIRSLTLALVLLVPVPAGAQGRFTSTASETRRVTQSLEREVSALAGRKTDLWASYRLTTPPSNLHTCGGSHVALETTTQATIMLKFEGGELRRIRLFTPECDVDTGSVPLVMLEGVAADDSANWLAGFARRRNESRDWQTRIGNPALSALALHTGDAALRSLIAIARDDDRADVRSRALSALGDRAGQQAAAAITGAVDRDPELEVKRSAVAALSRLPKEEGVPLLIQVARTNKNTEVRKEAYRRLGQTNDPRAVAFFEEILK